MAKNRRIFTNLDLSFLAAIHEDPCDDTPRLVYADWLEENGDAAQADFICLQCEGAKGVEVWRKPPTSLQKKRAGEKVPPYSSCQYWSIQQSNRTSKSRETPGRECETIPCRNRPTGSADQMPELVNSAITRSLLNGR